MRKKAQKRSGMKIGGPKGGRYRETKGRDNPATSFQAIEAGNSHLLRQMASSQNERGSLRGRDGKLSK